MVPRVISAGIAFFAAVASVNAMPTASVPSDCLAYYTPILYDNCTHIVGLYNNFTATELYEWNTGIGTSCFDTNPSVPLCINVPGSTYPGPVLAGDIFTPDETPVPVLAGIVPNCNKFEFTDKTGQPDFSTLLTQNLISEAQWDEWNPGHSGPWEGYFSCVGV